MKRLSASFLATIAILVTGGAAFGQVQQTGHSDCNSPGCYVGYQSCDWGSVHGPTHCAPGMANPRCRGCRKNQCPGGLCTGNFWTRDCLGNTCLGQCCATKAYPDSGWAPPARLPVNYDAAWYGSYHPQAFYGNPGGGFIANYPVVYQPTDTAQMGYYYQNVPTWQSRPGMIPSPPRPSDYHARVCTGNGMFHGGHDNGGHYSGGQCNGGQCNGGQCNGGQYNGGQYNGGQYSNSGMQPSTHDNWGYKPHYRHNMMPGSTAAAPVSLTKRIFRHFESASLTNFLD